MAVDLQSYYTTPELEAARKAYETETTQAAAYQSAASLLPYKLREALMEKLDYNRDIIEARNKAMAEYFQAPSAAREKYQDIWDPFKREALVAEERTQAYAPYATLTDILGHRMGTISDIIEAGTAGFQAATTAEQAEAQLAGQRYQDLFATAQALSGAAATEEQLRQSALTAGQVGGLTGVLLGQARQAMQADINNYTNLETLVKKYAPEGIPLYEIVNAYDAGPGAQIWGKHAEDWETIQGWTAQLTPTQLYQQTQAAEEQANLVGIIQNAYRTLESGAVQTGPTAGLILQGKSRWLGTTTPEEEAIINAIAMARSGELFIVGGKALTKAERAELNPYLPSLTLPTETNIKRLKMLEQKLSEKFAEIIEEAEEEAQGLTPGFIAD